MAAAAAPLARHTSSRTFKRSFPGVYSHCYSDVTRCTDFSTGKHPGSGSSHQQITRRNSTRPPLSHPNNLDGNKRHGGIPVGAIQIESSHVQSFKDLIHRVRRRKDEASFVANNRKARNLAFRGVAPFVGPSTYDQMQNTVGHKPNQRTRQLLVHLPTSVAAALDNGHPELVQFLHRHKVTYLAGFRRHPSHPEATRARRHSMISTYMDMPPKSWAYSLQRSGPHKFTYAELFAGIGGFRLGLDAIGGRCVFANEVDPYAASIYRRNFSSNGHNADCPLIEADILDLSPRPDSIIDVLCGGFPCQSFSVRGEQHALTDDGGQLYRELCRMLLSTQPRSFIFENVVGLVTLGGGRVSENGHRSDMRAGEVFDHVLQAFESCGYALSWNVIDAGHWVPQRRRRVFIVGIRKDIPAKFSWGWYDDMIIGGGGDKRVLRDVLEPKEIADPYHLSSNQWETVKRVHADRLYERAVFDVHKKSPTLISSYRNTNSLTTKYIFEEADGAMRDMPRFLSPREAARLQGFPEWFVAPIAADSDTDHAHFYKGIGNAVCPPLIESLGIELVRCIEEAL
mmetsp:Transcript_28042/g.81055  ORF Transcript_28042/g.81055 Transcript_28042/m.81055 type:complete len:568 (-) Transcript_28042:64-1767(-)